MSLQKTVLLFPVGLKIIYSHSRDLVGGRPNRRKDKNFLGLSGCYLNRLFQILKSLLQENCQQKICLNKHCGILLLNGWQTPVTLAVHSTDVFFHGRSFTWAHTISLCRCKGLLTFSEWMSQFIVVGSSVSNFGLLLHSVTFGKFSFIW